MDNYADYDGLGLAALVAAGEVTPRELLDAAMTRAEAAQAELNCFSALFPEMAQDQLAKEHNVKQARRSLSEVVPPPGAASPGGSAGRRGPTAEGGSGGEACQVCLVQ